MEGGGTRKREPCHQLLDLIHKDRFKGNEGNSFEVSEEKKLELRLGPPGEPWFINENQNNTERDALPLPPPPLPLPLPPSPMSFGCYSSKTHNTNWLMNNSHHENKVSTMEKKPPSSVGGTMMYPTFSGPSGFHKKSTQQQFQQPHKPKPSYGQLSSNQQNLNVMSKESSQTCSTKIVMSHTEKKAYFQTSASLPANTAVTNNSSQKRTAPAPAPVVGWPPIRSFRKNLANSISSSKQSPNGVIIPMETNEKPETRRKGLFVKINMDGIPIGRKVDLKAYDSYEKLSSAVDQLFSNLLAAQTDSTAAGNDNKTSEVKAITGLLDGSGEYTLVYEDHEGDRMLVGDVPWDMFASTVKRLRVLKSSELSALRRGSSKQAMTPLESAVK